MVIRFALWIMLLLPSANVFACFTDAGCPKGNICVKTGNLLGICLSQALPVGNQPTLGTSTSPQGIPGPTTVTTPNQTTVTAPGAVVNNPTMPVSGPALAGPCTNDINCPTGFACSRPAGTFRGVCTQVAQ